MYSIRHLQAGYIDPRSSLLAIALFGIAVLLLALLAAVCLFLGRSTAAARARGTRLFGQTKKLGDPVLFDLL